MVNHLISYTDSEFPLLKEVTPFFSPVKICLPWGKELPEIFNEKNVAALYPDENFKPDISFEKILNDCIKWLDEQGERSRIELVKAGAGTGTSEESFHRIRHLLLSRGSDASGLKNTANRYHLLIHLAGRIEENRSEANRMLFELKNKPSPLSESLDQTGKGGQSLGALPEINNDFVLEDAYITHFLTAWFGLFGDVIGDSRAFLTFNRRIFDRIFEKWNMLCGNEKLEESNLCFKAPVISDLSREEQKSLNNNGEIKEKWDQFKEVMSSSDIEPVERLNSLRKTVREFEKLFPEEMLKNHVLYTILFFDPPFDRDTTLKDEITKFLPGKVLIHAEK